MSFCVTRPVFALLTLPLLFAVGCKAPAKVDPAPVPTAKISEPETLPPWIDMPLSWEKLRTIELWIAAQDAGQRDYWLVEGELQLASGRLELSRRELSQEKARGNTDMLTTRIKAARLGMEKISQDASANPSQRTRASDGIARADRMLSELGKPALTLGVPLVARAQWGAAPAISANLTRNKGGWKRITVHHSAEADPVPLDGSLESSSEGLRQIQRSHLKSKQPPWGDIGYHFVIDPQGRVFQGRELAWQGAHASGNNNIQNIGVCLMGNFEEEHPTADALASLGKLLDNLRRVYSIPRREVHTHQQFKSTACPGKNLEPWVERYAQDESQKSRTSANSAPQATAKPSEASSPKSTGSTKPQSKNTSKNPSKNSGKSSAKSAAGTKKTVN